MAEHELGSALVGPTSGFFESLPLLVGAVALFLAGAVTWLSGIQAGAAHLPLWAMFVVTGFIASIGVVLSWFFAEGPRDSGEVDRESVTTDGPSNQPGPELGRPRPDVRALRSPVRPHANPPLEPWDEGPVSPPHVEAPPRVPRVESGRSDTDGVLDELENIAEALHSQRRRRGDPPP